MAARAFLILGLLTPGSATTQAPQPARRAVEGAAATDSSPPTILLLHAGEPSQPGHVALDAAWRTELRREFGLHVRIYSEFLDIARLPTLVSDQDAPAWYQRRYADRHIDLIFAAGEGALRFVQRWRGSLWTEVPVVFGALETPGFEASLLTPGITGVLVRLPVAPTLDLALRLLPDTARVVLPFGVAPEDLALRDAARADVSPFRSRVELVELNDLSNAETRTRLASLADHDIVLYINQYADRLGEMMVPPHLAYLLAESANRPMFSVHDTVIGAGVVGGIVIDYRAAGVQLARLGIRIIHGERLTGVVPPADGVVRPVFDWRQLRRWGISESALPPGSDVRYKTLTAWERYPRQIIGIALTGLLQAALIGLLLVERRRRRGSERQVRNTEALNEAVMASVTAPVAVLGQSGVVLRLNEAWMNPPSRLPSVFRSWRVATNCLDDLAGASDTYEAATAIREALEGVFAGRTRDAAIDLRDDEPDAERWYEMRIYRLERAEGGAVLSVLDTTSRKRAELEAQRNLLQMAHVNRVAALGELAASLAHELNQPLTAMLSNAQAGRRFLAAPIPDLAEIGGALDDIIQDDKRAGEVIRHMRALLTKTVFEPTELDMNVVARDVARLSAPAAGLGGVSLQLDLAPSLPRIRGDRVQLEQVVLNLVVNAVESTTDRDGPRRVRLGTRLAADDSIEIVVSDSGPGIPPDCQERIFEPFFTTKRDGLGMGLSISRSIVEAHGGRIEVENTSTGATFRVKLSATEVPAA